MLQKKLHRAITQVIKRGTYILGPEVELFEKEFAAYLGVSYAIGVASGTDALSLGLLAAGVRAGDEVILPANSYPTVFGVTAIGAVPRLVDIKGRIEEVITKKTKAIIPVHLYGYPADMNEICAIGRRHKIPIVEDCAQAHGATIKFQISNFKFQISKVGTIGDVGCFSFYPTKNLGCFGDGGMVVTNNPDIAKRLRLLRMYGEEKRYKSVIVGRNSRLDELQAAILRVKLPYLDAWNTKRRSLVNLYTQLLSHVTLPTSNISDAQPVHHLFVIQAKHRDKLQKYLQDHGIGTAIHYPAPIHLQESFRYLGYKPGDFPQTERACKEILSLPLFPELKHTEIKAICSVIGQFYDAKTATI